jgi:hexosaminidase
MKPFSKPWILLFILGYIIMSVQGCKSLTNQKSIVGDAKSAQYCESTLSEDLGIIPVPVESKRLGGRFELKSDTRILYKGSAPEISQVAWYLAEHINKSTGYELKPSSGHRGSNTILLRLNKEADTVLGGEGYRLNVTPDFVEIIANKAAGGFYGVQSLLQLLPPQIESEEKVCGLQWTIPCVEIVDYPRFGWRGLLLDVSRHFFTKDEVKAFIDRMARYKFNTFHWHLTDDQGWRVEIKGFPELTKVGAWRVPRQGYWWQIEPPLPGEEATYGGFYTQDEIRQIVDYARSRFITIVPEIDVPGHSGAALASYPDLSCGGGPFYVIPGSKFYTEIENTMCPSNDKVYSFLDTVYTEVAELFPGEYIHMGGDEAYKGFWDKCPRCQKFREDMGIKNSSELQSYFVKRVEKILESKGKRLIGWDEILESGLAPNATVMSWRGAAGGIQAAKMGHKIVMAPSPHYYLDIYQGDQTIEPLTYNMNRLNTCYGYEPLPEEIDSSLLLGIQGNLWSEEVSEFRHAQYMTWPRGFAIAETAWSPKTKKDWNNFSNRVEKHFKRMDYAKVKYAPSMFDVIFNPKWDKDNKLVIELATELKDLSIHYTFEGAEPDMYYPKYTKPLYVPKNAQTLHVITCRNGIIIGRQAKITIKELEERIPK